MLILVVFIFVIIVPPSVSVSYCLRCTPPSRLMSCREKKNLDTYSVFVCGGEEVGAISLKLYHTLLVSEICKFHSIIPFFFWHCHQELLSICKLMEKNNCLKHEYRNLCLISNRNCSSFISKQHSFDKSFENPL